MCGIFFCCSRNKLSLPSPSCLESLRRRGPDSFRIVSRSFVEQTASSQEPASSDARQPIFLTFVSTVLSLRGNSVVDQPLEDQESGSLLCWNGEAWSINDRTVDGNDAEIVFALCLKCTQAESPDQALQNILSLIASIAGPYSFVFYDARHQRVFYGRDALGRRSLALSDGLLGSFFVSSICDAVDKEQWAEVEANGIYLLDLSETFKSPAVISKTIVHSPWENGAASPELSSLLLSPFPGFNSNVEGFAESPLTLSSPSVDMLSQKLHDSLLLRLRNIRIPPSGTFISARAAILFSGGLDCTVLARLAHVVIPQEQDIDLLNIAFENPRVIQATAPSSSPAFALCPDRITGLSSYAEILKICPERTWRFLAIDISYAELQAHRGQIISLIHPHNTEMDFSIACALYFAARGSGTMLNADSTQGTSYTTPARVLLSGLGADELFGGYTRHSNAFSRRGYPGLVSELKLDFFRLGKRNCGRDDRVISYWGKEVRYPYLDEDLVSWALGIHVWEKCGFGATSDAKESDDSPALEPGKKVLRLVAWKLDLYGAAAEKKRALQFGARTAKMESGKKKGTAVLT